MRYSLLTVLSAFVVLSFARADTLFEDDFSDALDARDLFQWQWNKTRTSESDGAWIEVVADEETLFGAGVDNRVLVLNDRCDINQLNLYAKFPGAGDVVTVSFDFVEPNGSEGGPVVFRLGTEKNEPSELAVTLVLADGRFEPQPQLLYNPGDKHSITIVANNSPGALSYGHTQLLSQHYDVYLDGEQVRNSVPFQTHDASLPPGVPLDALRLLTYTDVTWDQTLLLDNVKVRNGAHAP